MRRESFRNIYFGLFASCLFLSAKAYAIEPPEWVLTPALGYRYISLTGNDMDEGTYSGLSYALELEAYAKNYSGSIVPSLFLGGHYFDLVDLSSEKALSLNGYELSAGLRLNIGSKLYTGLSLDFSNHAVSSSELDEDSKRHGTGLSASLGFQSSFRKRIKVRIDITYGFAGFKVPDTSTSTNMNSLCALVGLSFQL